MILFSFIFLLLRILAVAYLASIIFSWIWRKNTKPTQASDHFTTVPFFQRGFLRWHVRVSSAAPSELRQQFYNSALTMIGAVARADGLVKDQERELIHRVLVNELGLSPQAAQEALREIADNGLHPKSLQEVAHDFYSIFHSRRLMLENMLDILIYVACADSQLQSAEERVLRIVASIFKITNQTFHRLMVRNNEIARGRRFSQDDTTEQRSQKSSGAKSSNYSGANNESSSQRTRGSFKAPRPTNLDDALAILGSSRSDPIAVIKKKYRKLVLQLHPDRHRAQGLPDELQKFALERFRQVQEAYEYAIQQLETK